MKKIIVVVLTLMLAAVCVSCVDKPASEQTGPSQPENTGTNTTNTGTTTATSGKVYTITDYYNEDGGYSALGTALNEVNSEKVLVVSVGDVLVFDNGRYIIAADSLTLPFYTQPSFDEVVNWWTEHLESWEKDGSIALQRNSN